MNKNMESVGQAAKLSRPRRQAPKHARALRRCH